jgi:hypothetical protein
MQIAETSLEAFSNYQPHLNTDVVKITECFEDNPVALIPEEVSMLTGIPLVTCRARITGMSKEPMNILEVVCKKKNANGSNCRAYKLRSL